MIARDPPRQFTVERRRIMGAPGGSHDAARAPRRPVIDFVDAAGRIDVMLGAVCVGLIAINPAGGHGSAFFWRCMLPGCHATPQPAIDIAAARRAMRHRVADWFEATGDGLRARILREGRA